MHLQDIPVLPCTSPPDAARAVVTLHEFYFIFLLQTCLIGCFGSLVMPWGFNVSAHRASLYAMHRKEPPPAASKSCANPQCFVSPTFSCPCARWPDVSHSRVLQKQHISKCRSKWREMGHRQSLSGKKGSKTGFCFLLKSEADLGDTISSWKGRWAVGHWFGPPQTPLITRLLHFI